MLAADGRSGTGCDATRDSAPCSGYVARERLSRALTAGCAKRLTLVAAPAGYGKTSLVAAWCAQCYAHPTAWLSLEWTENDPILLARYLVRALGRPGAGSVSEPEPDGAPAMASMRALVTDLAEAFTETVLVLDDYDIVREPECHALVRFLLDHAPSSLHIIVCARADPALAIGSLRAAGQLAELRAHDLRMSEDEAAALLSEREGLCLDCEALADLVAHTEGWASGLCLSASWMRAAGAARRPADRFGGDIRHVVDYLSEVVLDRLADEDRDFLLCTSIVDRLSQPLCDAIVGRPSGAALDRLERSNTFLIALDERRGYYRYHRMFRETLRSELARRHSCDVAPLHRRASAWYRAEGLASEAIEHAADPSSSSSAGSSSPSGVNRSPDGRHPTSPQGPRCGRASTCCAARSPIAASRRRSSWRLRRCTSRPRLADSCGSPPSRTSVSTCISRGIRRPRGRC